MTAPIKQHALMFAKSVENPADSITSPIRDKSGSNLKYSFQLLLSTGIIDKTRKIYLPRRPAIWLRHFKGRRNDNCIGSPSR